MKFPRNAKILRSHFDAAPFAAVFFTLLIFVMLGALMPTPGPRLEPPTADLLPGPDRPTVAMAVDENGSFYFENQIVSERVLINELTVRAKAAPGPLTLIIHADKSVTCDTLMHLMLLARDHGITNAVLATLPPVESASAKP